MSTFKKLKIPMALLLTSGVVATTVAFGTSQSALAETQEGHQKSDAEIMGKSDYLPDVLGRIGYAIFMSKQRMLDNIRAFKQPEVDLLHAEVFGADSLDSRVELPDVAYYEESISEPIVSDIDHPDLEWDPRWVRNPIVEGHPTVPSVGYGVTPPISERPVEDPSVPELPVEEPSVPEVPVEEPSVPDLPSVPELPVEEPSVPDLPSVPELPAEEPSVPELPVEEPSVPELPVEEPSVPELPSDTPELPSELPNLPPDMPELPSDMPELPSDMPELPNLPPDMPELPSDIPELPSDMPDLPPDLPSDMPDLPPDLPSDMPDNPPIAPGLSWDDIPPAEPPTWDFPPTPSDVPPVEVGPLTPSAPSSGEMDDVRFREEVVTLSRGLRTEYDPKLPQGETRTVEGSDGQVIKYYKDIYRNGKLHATELVEEKTTVEPVADVKYIGSKPSQSATRVVDFQVGDRVLSIKVLTMKGDIEGFIGKTYEDLMVESEDARYQKATSQIDASFLGQDPTEPAPFDQVQAWLGAGDEVVNVYNSTNLVDKEKVNQYLVHYINMDRESKGLKKLQYEPELQKLTEVRAQEMAHYGHIRYNGLAHTRPDGSKWTTVLDLLPSDYKSYGFGENMLAYSILSNPYQLVSEQWIAKRLFEQWKASPSHYASMMNPEYTRTAVSFKLTTRGGAKSENGTNWMIASELFS